MPHPHKNAESERVGGGKRRPPPWPPDQGELGAHGRSAEHPVPILVAPELNDKVLRVMVADPNVVVRHSEMVIEEVAHHGKRNMRRVPPTSATSACPSSSSAPCSSANRGMTMSSSVVAVPGDTQKPPQLARCRRLLGQEPQWRLFPQDQTQKHGRTWGTLLPQMSPQPHVSSLEISTVEVEVGSVELSKMEPTGSGP